MTGTWLQLVVIDSVDFSGFSIITHVPSNVAITKIDSDRVLLAPGDGVVSGDAPHTH